MLGSFNVNWMEILYIALAMAFTVIIYYLINRKKIKQENRLEKLHRQRLNDAIKERDKKAVSPLVLQAYERMTIFLDRIDLQRLVLRVVPISLYKKDYADFLIQNIEQEYEYNASQQVYMLDNETWALILTAKNTVIQSILKNAIKPELKDAKDLQSKLLADKGHSAVLDIAKTKLKRDIKSLL